MPHDHAMKNRILLTALGAAAAIRTSAALITFDDLPLTSGTVPKLYAGLNWNKFYHIDGTGYDVNSGYHAGVRSPNNVAFDAGGGAATLGGGPFDLNSAYLTAAWRDNLAVTVVGSLDGKIKYTKICYPSATGPMLIQFDFLGVDNVLFTPSGGTKHPGYTADGTQFVVDDMTINAVPEPGTYLAGLSALGLLGWFGWRRLP